MRSGMRFEVCSHGDLTLGLSVGMIACLVSGMGNAGGLVITLSTFLRLHVRVVKQATGIIAMVFRLGLVQMRDMGKWLAFCA